MAEGSPLLELKNPTPIKPESFKNVKNFVPKYLSDIDTLVLRPKGKSIPAVSIDIDGEMYVRVAPETGEIVGLEIEDVDKYFAQKYPEFGAIWKQAKRSVAKSNCNDRAIATFMSIVYDLLEDVFKEGDGPQIMSHSPI